MEKKLITIEEKQYWDKIKNTSQIISYDELIYIDPNFIDELINGEFFLQFKND